MSKKPTSALWISGLLLVAPLLLGAKGCDAVVGNEKPKTCGGLTGAACDGGQFCDFAPDALCGAADATGVCRAIPEVCTLQSAPVCGCDDMTYGNACEANAAGISVASDGACDPGGGDVCGGLLGAPCGTGEFCNFPPDALCGAADATGICTPTPEACDAVFDPVCGCNDMTYGNACEANMAGVSIASDGACDPGGGDVCGGLLGTPCGAGEFCNFPPDALCGAADATGVCMTRPEICADIYSPVCGCDGQTYSNACEANGAGVSVASDGECEPSPDPGFCGGIAGFTCPASEFCNYALDASCGVTDVGGTCTPIPEFCTEQYAPVCGCDGMTYDNECFAHGAGVSVGSTGPCP